jgi:uncharacterized protein YdeI (YjbR/CyaY-like superfamily)
MAASKQSKAVKNPESEPLHNGLPILAFPTEEHWRQWLRRNHEQCEEGLWVKLAKKGAGVDSISYEQARDAALAHGWIDGLKAAFDTQFYGIRFTPRRSRSKWSKINCEIAEKLIAAGEMTAAGLAQVQAARKDGRWDAAYAGAATIELHPELERALQANPAARKFFATVSAANRYAVLYNVQDAKRPETRARRIEKFVAMLARGEVVHPER